MFGLSDSVTGAALGACITLIGLIVSKEGKVSEFRQAWIDKLRDDVSGYIEAITQIEMDKRAEREQDGTKYARANFLGSRIRLHLNPNEQESRLLVAALIRPVSAHDMVGPRPDELYQEDLTNINEATQAVLKKEWKRVKRGEPIYRCVFYGCLTMIGFAILLTIRQHLR